MARPKLTREDCADIRRMYADRTRKETSGTLARQFHVSSGTIIRVLDKNYTPLEDYQEKRNTCYVEAE
jgi:DNA invertase Pin-like site-specific DNA recombinase